MGCHAKPGRAADGDDPGEWQGVGLEKITTFCGTVVEFNKTALQLILGGMEPGERNNGAVNLMPYI